MKTAEEQFEEFYLSLRGNHTMSYISCAFARFYAKQVAEQVLIDAAKRAKINMVDYGSLGFSSYEPQLDCNSILETPIVMI